VSATVIGIGLLLVMAAVVVPLIIWYFSKYVWVWKTVTFADLGVTLKLVLPPDVHSADVNRALRFAVLQLSAVWPRQRVLAELQDVSILVASVDKWQNIAGQTVGGEQDSAMLKVNHAMDSLLHECAHWLELRIDGVRDDTHAAWASKGIFKADDAYRASVASASP
jgi:hypothetical protein